MSFQRERSVAVAAQEKERWPANTQGPEDCKPVMFFTTPKNDGRFRARVVCKLKKHSTKQDKEYNLPQH